MPLITFRPKQVTKRLLSVLPERARDVLVRRFGLDTDEAMTLEAIGEKYGITRERVRQIESFAINTIRKSDVFEKEKNVFDELEKALLSLGGIVSEQDIFEHLTKDKNTENHLLLYLVLGDSFKKHKEDASFSHRWAVDEDVTDTVHAALEKLYASLSDEDIVPESEIIAQFLDNLKDISDHYKQEEILRRWLRMSKKIAKNPLGEWGVAESPNIRTRGIRDYAYLIIRKHGSPMHFSEVAKDIERTFGKKAHVATTHNELIKDPRFVLVGRGLYALSEWGYSSGVVRDVIRDILKKHGPLTRDEIIEKVLKERYVKSNTITVNLQNTEYFKKDKNNKYSLA